MEEIIFQVLEQIPSAGLAAALFYLCQRNSESTISKFIEQQEAQRLAYAQQLVQLYGMLEKMLATIGEKLSVSE